MDSLSALSHWDLLLETLPQGVLVADAEGRFVKANKGASRVLGWSRQDLLSSGLFDPRWTALSPDGATLAAEEFPAVLALRSGTPVQQRMFGLTQEDGETRWLEVSAAPLPAGGVVMTFDDVTERHRSKAVLEARSRIVDLAPGATLEEVLRATLDEAERLTGSCIGFYHFMEEDQATLTLQAWSTRTTREFCQAEGQGLHYPVDQAGVWVDAVRERRPVIHNDYASLPHRRGLPPGHAEVKRELVVPVLRGERIVAVLGVGNKPFPYGAHDVDTVERLAALAWDTAEHKRTQESLRFSEAALEHSLNAVALADLEGRLRYVNPAFVTLWGLEDRYQCVGSSVLGFWADQEAAKALLSRLLASGQPVDGEMRALRPDGTYRDVHFTANLAQDAMGRTLGALATFTDITERKRADEALRESERRFRKAIEEAPFPVMIHAEDGEVIALSRAWTDLSGYAQADIPTIAEWTGKAYGERAQAVLQEIKTFHDLGLPKAEGEYVITCRDGSQRCWDFSSVPLGRLPDGRRITTSMASDVTQRKRAEEQQHLLQAQLLQAQKMESLGSLAGGVAHDMNNVLGAILGLSSAHMKLQATDSSVYRAFETISQAAIRGGQMVRSLLSFAHQQPTEPREVDLNALVREVVLLLDRTTLSKVRLETVLASDLRPVWGDANALTHAVMNTCVNSVDAMPDGGSLILRTRNVDPDRVEVEVEDTGSGMSPEILARALEPFFTTKEQGKGTGLGLSLAYSTVRSHHGQVDIRSEAGRGTLVTMSFPACAPAPPSRPEPRADAPQRALEVLVIDDDDLIQDAMQALLEALGHNATPASSGEEALGKLEAGLEPDVIILDMNMPGLGGKGTLPRLRALRPSVPVLLATGRADQAAADLVETYAGVTLLPKPFGLKDLRARLQT